MKIEIEFNNTVELGEKLRGLLEFTGQLEFTTGAVIKLVREEEAPSQVQASAAPPADVIATSKEERAAIKAELDELGIDYNTRLATINLAILLEEAKTAPVPLPEDSGAGFVEPPSPTPEPVTTPAPVAVTPPPTSPEVEDLFGEESLSYTKEEVRAALMVFIEKTGDDGQAVAIKLLDETVGVKRLADAPAERYPDIMKALGV